MTSNKELAIKYAREIYNDMLLAIEWQNPNLELEKKSAKQCAIVAVNLVINATTNFSKLTGIEQNTFYIDVLEILENYD